MITTIAVAGAGTMGSGIAQVAAQSGYQVILFDLNEAVLQPASVSIQQSLQYLVKKQALTQEQHQQILGRIFFTSNISDCVADVIIEAIAETISAKAGLFSRLAPINAADTIFVSNTSSLSISQIQAAVLYPERVAGMHFFNPAPVMKLVEVVQGEQTNKETIQAIVSIAKKMNKMPVICKDSPGFIVNRVARHYYLEAMLLVTEGIADIEDVDTAMAATGFKMGPFRLMDLIGLDVNLAVSKSIYASFGNNERFAPSPLQVDKVNNAELGKKSGKGFYTYPNDKGKL